MRPRVADAADLAGQSTDRATRSPDRLDENDVWIATALNLLRQAGLPEVGAAWVNGMSRSAIGRPDALGA